MSNLSIILGFPIGILGFLFLIWKRLKEDYTSEQIFSFSFIILAFILVGFVIGFVSRNIAVSGLKNIFSFSGIWFWTSFIFGLIGFLFAFYKFNLRLFETLEAVAVSFVFWFFTICIINSVAIKDFRLLSFSLLIILLIPLFSLISQKYKLFRWYKSGKIGFAGLTILAIFFLVRVVFALIDPSMLSFVGKFDAILSSITSFLFFIVLYNLSEVTN